MDDVDVRGELDAGYLRMSREDDPATVGRPIGVVRIKAGRGQPVRRSTVRADDEEMVWILRLVDDLGEDDPSSVR